MDRSIDSYKHSNNNGALDNYTDSNDDKYLLPPCWLWDLLAFMLAVALSFLWMDEKSVARVRQKSIPVCQREAHPSPSFVDAHTETKRPF